LCATTDCPVHGMFLDDDWDTLMAPSAEQETIRDRDARAAMKAYVALESRSFAEVAVAAFEQADAMQAARERLAGLTKPDDAVAMLNQCVDGQKQRIEALEAAVSEARWLLMSTVIATGWRERRVAWLAAHPEQEP